MGVVEQGLKSKWYVTPALFFASLFTVFVSLSLPISVVIATSHESVSDALIFIPASLVLTVLGAMLTVRLARARGVSLLHGARLAAFLLAFISALMSVLLTTYYPVPGTMHCTPEIKNGSVCTQSEILRSSPGAIALVSLAALLIFVSLIFAPSSEKELSRRIDLEACGVAVPFSFFFFFSYEWFQRALTLPRFSTGVAVGTLLATYLLARLALTIRYR